MKKELNLKRWISWIEFNEFFKREIKNKFSYRNTQHIYQSREREREWETIIND